MTLDYFYGQSGELFSYFRIPKVLFQDSHFRQLSAALNTKRSNCSGNWRTSTSLSANAVVWADPA